MLGADYRNVWLIASPRDSYVRLSLLLVYVAECGAGFKSGLVYRENAVIIIFRQHNRRSRNYRSTQRRMASIPRIFTDVVLWALSPV